MSKKKQILLVLILTMLGCSSSTLAQQYPGGGYTGPPSKEQLLQSSRWRQIERRFNDWLSVQRIYNEAQVAQVKSRLSQQVRAMNAVQLEDFMSVAEEKLNVLLSNESSEARTYMSFYTDNFLQKKMGEAPDITTMTATKMRDKLGQFQEERRGASQAQQTFNRLEAERSKNVMRQEEQMRQRQMDVRDPRYYAYRNPYDNRRSFVQPSPYAPHAYHAPRPQFSVSPWGGIWRSLP